MTQETSYEVLYSIKAGSEARRIGYENPLDLLSDVREQMRDVDIDPWHVMFHSFELKGRLFIAQGNGDDDEPQVVLFPASLREIPFPRPDPSDETAYRNWELMGRPKNIVMPEPEYDDDDDAADTDAGDREQTPS